MPIIRSYPETTILETTDALLLDRLGVGTFFIEGSNFTPSTAWSALSGIPASIQAIDSLTPIAGQIIEFTGPTSASLVPFPVQNFSYSALTSIPNAISALNSLTPANGQIVEYTSAGTAHMIPTPSGGGGSISGPGTTHVGSLVTWNSTIGTIVADPNIIPSSNGYSLISSTNYASMRGLLSIGSIGLLSNLSTVLSAGTGISLATSSGVTTVTNTGSGGSGNMQPRLLSDLGAIDGGGVNTANNDAAFTAAEAASDTAFYIPDGIYATARSETLFAKHYVGRGVIKFPSTGNDVLPARYSYLATKAAGAGGTGRTGWFAGGNQFTEQGYSVIGPNVRTFDTSAIYYDSTTIPQNTWMDINSGNSGCQAFLTSGASSGSTVITLPGAADATWVGKTVAFANSYGGSIVESKTVTAVNTAGNNITVNTALGNTYTWNPSGGLAPNIFFAQRTWGGEKYLKMTANGGGDFYGHNVRTIANYSAKATEQHTFQAGTYSQYGGDVNAGGDGIMLQNWESQLQSNGHDVGAIGFVNSFVRAQDAKLNGGRFWGGTWFQSTGTVPADVCHSAVGFWRIALDTANGTLYETSTLTGTASAGSNVLNVVSTNGAHLGDTVQIAAEVFTINGIVTNSTITLSANLIGTYTTGTEVIYPSGGVTLNMKKGQRFVFNSTMSQNGRGGDTLGVFAPFYGNIQGDMMLDTGVTSGADYIALRIVRGTTAATPDIARLRLKGDNAGNGIVQIFGTGTHTIAGTGLGLAAGCALNLSTGSLFTLGSGCYMYSDGAHIYATNNGGSSFVTIV